MPPVPVTTPRRALLVVAIAATLGGALLAVALDDTTASIITALGSQLVADLVAMTLCATVALRAEGMGRVAWSTLAGGLALWVASDIVLLAHAPDGLGSTGAEIVDTMWVVSGVCFATAVVLMYARVRPERGWQGALDALALAISLGIVSWQLALRPVRGGADGVVDATWLVVPSLAIGAAAVAGWLVLRLRGGPAFLRLTLVALVLLVAGEAVYLWEAVEGVAEPGGSWVLFTATAWTLALAAASRLAHPWSRLQRAESPPPAWSDAVPAVAILSAVAMLALHEGVLGAVVLLATAIAMVRMVTTSRTNARLLATRDAEATTDPLTGALNRRRLAEDLLRLSAHSRRLGAKLSAVAIDLDGFKLVNDAHGHQHGDRLLMEVVDTLRGHLRTGDLLYRVGGDEFVALLPDTPAGEAIVVAERLRERVAATAGAAGVTISLGVAEGPTRWAAPEALLEDADAALYRAKQGGRDRVVGAPSPRASGAGPILRPE